MPAATSPHIRKRTRAPLHRGANTPTDAAGGAPTPNWPLGGPQLEVEHVPTAELKLPKRQLRKRKAKQISQIEASVRRFGFTNPILVDADGVVVAGVGRLLAARNLKLLKVPVVRLEHLSEAELRAYRVADNRLAELSGWDEETLALELGELLVMGLDFEIELTGFTTAEIDNIVLGDSAPPDDDPDDEQVDEPAAPVSRLGDIFVLGQHRLICGDARDPAVYTALMQGGPVRAVFSDVPYNVAIAGHVSGKGVVKHGEFAMASGEMSRPEFTVFLTDAFQQAVAASADGSIHFQCIDWRHVLEMQSAGEAAYTELKNIIVWKKNNAGMGSFYRSHHEFIFVWKSGTAPHVNNFGLGDTGRYRTNIWEYAGVNTFGQGRMADLAAHPTVKPTALVADAIRDVTKRGDIMLDPFCGSGTTLLAAQRTGRRARCIELDPKYVDVAIRRFEERTGIVAVHEATGLSLDHLAAARAADGQ